MSAKRNKTKGPGKKEPLKKNGWTLYAHPAFLDQLEKVAAKAEAEKDPQGHATKVTAWITRAVFDEIPQDPTLAKFRMGGALRGPTHWFRDKYAGRFRLFFRYNSSAKIIIYGWVNDEHTLRTYGSKTDAYQVFKGMHNPPDGWEALLKESSASSATKRLKGGQKP